MFALARHVEFKSSQLHRQTTACSSSRSLWLRWHPYIDMRDLSVISSSYPSTNSGKLPCPLGSHLAFKPDMRRSAHRVLSVLLTHGRATIQEPEDHYKDPPRVNTPPVYRSQSFPPHFRSIKKLSTDDLYNAIAPTSSDRSSRRSRRVRRHRRRLFEDLAGWRRECRQCGHAPEHRSTLYWPDDRIGQVCLGLFSILFVL